MRHLVCDGSIPEIKANMKPREASSERAVIVVGRLVVCHVYLGKWMLMQHTDVWLTDTS